MQDAITPTVGRLGARSVRWALALVAVAAFAGSGRSAVALATCTISWDGGAGTNSWHTAANWAPDQVPTASDHVCIPNMTPNVTVTFSTGTTGIRSLQADEAVSVTSNTLSITDPGNASELRAGLSVAGALTVDSPMTVSSLTQTSGTIAGSATITVTGAFTFTGGTQNGPGATTIASGATGLFNGPDGATNIHNSRTLTNEGTLSWTGGWMYSGQGASSAFNNRGTMTITGSGAINNAYCCGSVLMTNTGTITKTAGTSAFVGRFVNDGAIVVNGGWLTLNGGTSTSDGTYTVASGTTLELAGTTHTLSAASSVIGPGALRLSGTTNIAGAIDVGPLTVMSGTNTLTGPAPTPTSVAVSGGTVAFETTFAVPTLTQTGGTIGGAGSITATSAFTFTAGTQNGPGATTIASGATGLFNGPDGGTNIHNSRTLTNEGALSWTGGWMYSGQGASSAFNNRGTMTITGSGAINNAYCCGSVLMTNTGTITKTAGTSTFIGRFVNDGSIIVNGGWLTLNGGASTSDGTYTVASGTTLELAGATHTLSAASSVIGTGTLRLSGTANIAGSVEITTLTVTAGTQAFTGVAPQTAGVIITAGTATFDAPFTASTLTQTGGTIGGTGSITISDAFTFTAGTQNGPGATTIASGATALFNGPDGAINIHNSRTLTNEGALSWTGGFMYTGQGASSAFNNRGTMTISGSGAINNGYCCGSVLMTNTGTITKTAGTSNFIGRFVNDGAIVVNGGWLTLNGGASTSDGTYTVASGTTLELAGTTHTLSAASSISGPGTLRLSGTTNIAGAIDVGPLTVISGTNTLTGPAPTPTSVAVSGGTVAFETSFAVPTLTQTGGTIGGAGSITATNAFTFTFGTQNGPGKTIIGADATGLLNGSDGWTNIHYGRTLTNDGALTWSGGFMYSGQGAGVTLENTGTMVISATGGLYNAYCCGTATVRNTGTITKTGTATATMSATTQNTGGVIEVRQGRLNLSSLSNFSTATKTLTGGTYIAQGTLAIGGADIVTNAAAIVLEGTGARVLHTDGSDALRNLTTNAAAGSLTMKAGAGLITRAVTNAGEVQVGAASTFLPAAYTQSSGTTTLAHPSARLGTGDGAATIDGGTVQGVGSISPNLINRGHLSPGLSPGTLRIDGDVTMDPSSTTAIEIGGGRAGVEHDQVVISGAATLDGTLALTTVGGFDPQDGDTFEIVTVGARTGTFSAITGADIGNGLYYDLVYDTDGATVVVRKPGVSVADISFAEGDDTTSATFTVSLAPAPFTPVSVAYTTTEGTAVDPDDYTAASGVLTFAPGETTKTVEVVVVGDVLDEADETFTLTLSDPVNATLADDAGVATIIDDDGTPAISISDASALEGNAGSAPMTFTVSLSEPSGVAISAAYATSDRTATAGTDYDATSGTVSFAPGETVHTVTVPVLGDAADERDEAFAVTLSSLDGVEAGDADAIGTITDDDGEPTMTISDVRVGEPDSGTTPARFVVALSAPSGLPIDVAYTTQNGSAIAPQDYDASAGNIVFAPGETAKTLPIDVVGDTLDEADETFTVSLTGASDALFADDLGVATIVDNDAPPTVTIGDVAVSEGDEPGSIATLPVTLSEASGIPVTVSFQTRDGSAGAPSDYAAASGSLTFTPGQTAHTIQVQIAGDRVDEPGEAFSVELAGAHLADGVGIVTILDDDPNCTIIGSPRDDVLTGTDGDDVICGLGGDDIIIGLGGNDTLVGGDDNDLLLGATGDDTLQGDAGDDRLVGGTGADRVRGDAGDDEIDVHDLVGDDLVDGGAGTDACRFDDGDNVTSCP